MGKASRIKAQRDGKFEREPKRPTGRHLTKKEAQEIRRQSRRLDQEVESMVAKLASAQRAQYLKEQGL